MKFSVPNVCYCLGSLFFLGGTLWAMTHVHG